MRPRLIGGILLEPAPSLAVPIYMENSQYFVAETKYRGKRDSLIITGFTPFDHTNFGGKVIKITNGRYSAVGDAPQFVLVKANNTVAHGKVVDIRSELEAAKNGAKPTILRDLNLVLNSVK